MENIISTNNKMSSLQNSKISVELRNILKNYQGEKPKRMFYKGKATKGFLKWNMKVLQEGLTFKHINMIQSPNLIYDKSSNKLIDGKALDKRYKKIKKITNKGKKDFKFTNDKTLIKDKNLKSRTNQKYRQVISKLIDTSIKNVKEEGDDSLEITINLLKINFKTLIDLIKDKDEATKTTYKGIDDNENDFETTFLLSARPEGSDKWITFSQGNLLKLKDYEDLRGDDFNYRVGSDNEFINSVIDNPLIVIKFKKAGYEVNNGGFFKYYHTTSFNLERYGLYNKSENLVFKDKNGIVRKGKSRRYNDNCLYNAFKHGGMDDNKLALLKAYVKSSRVPVNKLEIISKKLDIHIELNKPRTNGDVEVIHKNKNATEKYKIGLIENHYFIIDKDAEITGFALKNYDMLSKYFMDMFYKDNEGKALDWKDFFNNDKYKFNNIIDVLGKTNDGKLKFKRASRWLNSYSLISKILKYKLVKNIPVDDLGASQYHSELDYENESLHYDVNDSCAENTCISTDRTKAEIIFFDFETIVRGNTKIFRTTRDDMDNVIDKTLVKTSNDFDDIENYLNDKKNYQVEYFRHTPYLMCFQSYDDFEIGKKNIETVYGATAGQKFIDIIKFKNRKRLNDLDFYLDKYGGKNKDDDGNSNKNSGKIGEILLVAHNSKYDTAFIKDYLYNFMPLHRGNSQLNASARIYIDNKFTYFIEINIQDSYCLIPEPLRNFASMFGLENFKEVMPYDLYTTENVSKRYINKEICLSFVKEVNDKETYINNCKRWSCIKKGMVDIIEYSKRYCELDIIVLRDGYMKFKNDIEKITGLNIKNYCSIASLGYDSLVKKGCLEDCYKLSGIPREFIQKFVVGGKCMTNSNKKWLFESKIDSRGKYLNWLEDFDACSLYPSALYRMKGFIKGKPIVIPDKLKDIEKLLKFDAFYVKVKCLNDTDRPLQFPLLSSFDDNGIRDFSNNTKDKIYYIDKTCYEDVKEHLGLKFKVICGYYFNEGFNDTINSFIKELYTKRKEEKKKGNKIEKVYKLLMNSCYGKTLLKPIEEETKTISLDKWNKEYSRYYNFIKEYTICSNYVIYKKVKTITEQFNNAHQGCAVLTMSKRIMNEVMVMAERMGMMIYTTDTDSIHLEGNDLDKLRKAYNKKYCSKIPKEEKRFRQKDLIGNFMGQFHSDFDSKKLEENMKKDDEGKPVDIIRACYSVFLGKKCYLDKLYVEDKHGDYHYDYHVRMKGVSNDAIKHFIDEKNKVINEGNYSFQDVYNHLYFLPKEPLNFDLLCGGNKCSFQYNSDLSITTKSSFSRSLSFKYEAGVVV